MRGFLSCIAAMMLVVVLALVFVLMGFVSMRADNPPSKLETALAGRAMDSSVARAAAKVTNPMAADDANLVAGAILYRDHCALCHGDPIHPKAPLADSLNPPAPQFMNDKPDMPEHQNYFILQHGIRWTGMPAWKNTLKDEQLWQLVTFLSHMQSLPPAAKQVFSGTEPPTQVRSALSSNP